MTVAVRLPDGRTINVQTNDPAQAALAGRRVLAYEAANKVRPPDNFATHAADAMTLGADRPIDAALNAGVTGIGNLIDRAQGKTPAYGMGDTFEATRQLENDRAKQYATAHPVANLTSGLLGGMAMPGAGPIADFIGAGAKVLPGATGLLPGAARTANVAARSGVVGGLLGGVSGATTANPGQVGQGAVNGAVTGAVTGAVLPFASKVAVNAARTAAPVAQTIARAANKAGVAMGAPAFLDPQQVAGQRLAATLKADGATPQQLTGILGQWLKTGVSPALMDLASSLPNGGQSTMGLLRGAAMKAGPARGAAMAYADKTASDLQGNAIDLTRNLTPNKAPASIVEADLTQSRGALANQQYPAAYPQAVDTAPLMDAVSGDAGKRAISGAAKIADANRLAPETAELTAIKTAANPPPQAQLPAGAEMLGPDAQAQIRAQIGAPPPVPPTTRLGTLDQIKQSFVTMAQDAAKSGDMNLARGYGDRAREIDDHLADLSPDYALARDNYAAGSNRIDAVNLGKSALQTAPDDYAASLEAMKARTVGQGPSPVQGDAGVGFRQALTDAIGAPTEAATGTLNKVGTSTNAGRNLAATYGQDAADTYQGGVNNLRRGLANARFIDPSTGSQTAGRAVDADLADVSPPKILGVVGALVGMVNKVRRGATLTDEERQALVQMGTSIADPSRIAALPMAVPNPAMPVTSLLAAPVSEYAASQ